MPFKRMVMKRIMKRRKRNANNKKIVLNAVIAAILRSNTSDGRSYAYEARRKLPNKNVRNLTWIYVFF